MFHDVDFTDFNLNICYFVFNLKEQSGPLPTPSTIKLAI